MITKTDAIKFGKAICAGLVKEQQNYPNSPATFHMRGVANYALDNIWYDVLSAKVKEQFNNSTAEFYTACGWPE